MPRNKDEDEGSLRDPRPFQIRLKRFKSSKVLHKRNLNYVKNFEKERVQLPCFCHKAPWEEYPHLQDTLPEGYEYRVCHYISGKTPGSFDVKLRLPFMTGEKVLEWKMLMENQNVVLFRSKRTYNPTGQVITYKKSWACQHRQSRGTGKIRTVKTGCEAQLTVTVKKPIHHGSADSHLPDLPTIIYMTWTHNHPRNAVLPAIRCGDISEDTREQFVDFFYQGHSPSSAIRLYRTKLEKETGESTEILSQNKRIWPEKIFVVRLFRKLRLQKQSKEENEEHQAVTDIPADVPIVENESIEIAQVPTTQSLEELFVGQRPVDVILPAAGTSNRMGSLGAIVPKQFQKILGVHLIAYTVDCFHKIPWIRHIVLVVSPTQEQIGLDLVNTYEWSKVRVCPGGETRHRSIKKGVEWLKNECIEDSIVIIHDGARPFVPEDIVEKVVKAAEEHGAVGVVRPLVSTVIKPDKEATLESTLIRTEYRNSEMPQAFQYHVIAKAYEMCSSYDLEHGTECLLLVLQYANYHAHLVDGTPDLWKVTYAKDLHAMESAVKEKFVRLSITVKVAHPLVYLKNLRNSLEEKRITVCKPKNRTANTSICFLDLPDKSTPPCMSNVYCGWVKHITTQHKKLSWIQQRIGLFILLVFVAPPEGNINDQGNGIRDIDRNSNLLSQQDDGQHTQRQDSPPEEGQIDQDWDDDHNDMPNQFDNTPPLRCYLTPPGKRRRIESHNQILETYPGCRIVTSSTSSLSPPTSSSEELPSTQPVPSPPLIHCQSMRQQQQQDQISITPISNSLLQQQRLLLLQQKKLLLRQLKIVEEQQRLLEQVPTDRSPTPNSNLVFLDKHKTPEEVEEVYQRTSKSKASNFTPHQHKQHTDIVPVATGGPNDIDNTHANISTTQNIDNNNDDINDDNDNVVDEQSNSDMESSSQPVPQISNTSESSSNSACSQYQFTMLKQTQCRAKKRRQKKLLNPRYLGDPDSHDIKESSFSNTLVRYIPVCQEYMGQIYTMVNNNSVTDVCITSVLSQNGKDLTDKLVELVWNRSRGLDGQVLLM